jgi:hypothetical protein
VCGCTQNHRYTLPPIFTFVRRQNELAIVENAEQARSQRDDQPDHGDKPTIGHAARIGKEQPGDDWRSKGQDEEDVKAYPGI